MNPNQKAARDLLAYILTGEFDGDAYDLNQAQVDRMEEIMNQIAQGRMLAVTELPPIQSIPLPKQGPPSRPEMN